MKKKIAFIIFFTVLIMIVINIVTEKQILKENNENIVLNNEKQEELFPKNELFSQYYDQAIKMIETMTIEEKVGQMFLVRYPENDVISEILQDKPGGYILFARDFKNKTKESILQELNNCQLNSKIKLILAVDEEGGTVIRVSRYKKFRNSKFLSPQQLWAKGGLQAILDDSTEKTELLKSIGLNMNLAPVADVSTNSSDFIYKRSFGKSANETAQYVTEVVNRMNKDGIISSMKHFPGYGNNIDTHTGIAIDNRTYENFINSDFLPFQKGIEVNAPTILVSHNIVNCMDKNKPASLSEEIHRILREKLNFSGIIMTDDLAMDAVKSYVENENAAVQAILAGNDMIISSDFKNQKQEVINAVIEGQISEEIINVAVRRILALKFKYGII